MRLDLDNKTHMMMLRIVLLVVVVTAVALLLGPQAKTDKATDESSSEVSSDISHMKRLAEQEAADLRLGQYTINAMWRTGAREKLSDARKQTLARAIVRVSNDIFETEEHKKAFVAVIAIESGFHRFAQSPTGPKGLTQVAKSAFIESMASCGITGLNDDDIWDTDINLYAGACYFRKQLDKNNGDTYMAIIAYNQGPNSDSLKTYAKNGSLDNIEVLKYVAKFTFLKRTVTDEKEQGTPAMTGNVGQSSGIQKDKQ